MRFIGRRQTNFGILAILTVALPILAGYLLIVAVMKFFIYVQKKLGIEIPYIEARIANSLKFFELGDTFTNLFTELFILIFAALILYNFNK